MCDATETDHVYLSTACHHDKHPLCGVKQAERGEKCAPHCKHCPAPCVCWCHELSAEYVAGWLAAAALRDRDRYRNWLDANTRRSDILIDRHADYLDATAPAGGNDEPARLRAEVASLEAQLDDVRALREGEAGEWDRLVRERDGLRAEVKHFKEVIDETVGQHVAEEEALRRRLRVHQRTVDSRIVARDIVIEILGPVVAAARAYMADPLRDFGKRYDDLRQALSALDDVVDESDAVEDGPDA